MARSRHWTSGHGVTAGTGSRCQSLAGEQFANVSGQRAISKARRSVNGAPGVGLSPLSLLGSRDDAPLGVNMLRWLVALGSELPLGFKTRRALVVT